MGKKRKSVATSLDEVDRTMHTTFCSAANSLSQLYTQAMNQQKLSFLAGERNGLEKLYQWIWRQEEAGTRVKTADIITYLQNEIDYCGEEASMSSRVPFQHQHSQPTLHSSFLNTANLSGVGTAVQETRSEPPSCDNQSKNQVFSNALSSPVRRSLQNYQLSHGSYTTPSGNVTRNNEPIWLPKTGSLIHLTQMIHSWTCTVIARVMNLPFSARLHELAQIEFTARLRFF